MSTYRDIGDAFGRYCEVAWRLAGDSRAVAQHLRAQIYERGQIPASYLTFCPPMGEQPDLNREYGIDDAVRHEGGAAWAIGFLLKVKRGVDFWPFEYLRFDVILTTSDTRYNVQLRDSRIRFAFDPVESEETHRILNEFSQSVVDGIYNFYERHPERLKNGEPVVMGFSQVRT